MLDEVESGVPLDVLNLRYKLYDRKHVLDIVPHNIPYFDDVTYGNNSMSDDDHVHEYVDVVIIIDHGEVVNNNNNKSHGIVTRKKAQLVEEVYVEDSTHNAHLEATKILLGLSYCLMLSLY